MFSILDILASLVLSFVAYSYNFSNSYYPSSTIHSDYFPSEVITYDQWMQLKPEPKSMFSGWIKGAFRGGKKEMQESIHQKLNFTLSTAPMWDRFVVPSLRFSYSCSSDVIIFFPL